MMRQPFSCECIEDRDDRERMWYVARIVCAGKSSYFDNKTTRAMVARVVYILMIAGGIRTCL